MTSMAQVTAKFKSTGNKQSCSELKIGNFSKSEQQCQIVHYLRNRCTNSDSVPHP